MGNQSKISKQNQLRSAISALYREDEEQCVNDLLLQASMPEDALNRVHKLARRLVEQVRAKRIGKGGLDAFLYQYDLSNEEGIALMCMAEALLRIPDKNTADKLIRDKVLSADWSTHAGKSDSMFVNAATWGLMLTGKVYSWQDLKSKNLTTTLKNLTRRSGEPVIRKSVNYAMKILGKQFVMGRTINEALKRARELEAKGYRYSYDMLGEAARTEADALKYLQSYINAIHEVGKAANQQGPIKSPGVSVKLSALHPRYEFSQQDRCVPILVERLLQLAHLAKQYDIGLTVDAEEADRLDLSLDIIEGVFSDPSLEGWDGFGLAVQSYQKRAPAVIDWLVDLSKRYQRRIMIRLIKGAYWDSEIKASQELGLEGYPVFTRKPSTDVSFLACARRIIEAGDAFYPQFATHNAYSVAAILEMIGERRDFEFQCLHGMGQALYDEVVGEDKLNYPCRIYAPVGSHEDLLAYLVRRLLENGANTSFVNRIVDSSAPIDEIIADPVKQVQGYKQKSHPKIPLPENIYGAKRLNAKGIDLSNHDIVAYLNEKLNHYTQQQYHAGPIINGETLPGDKLPVVSPADNSYQVGTVTEANLEHVNQALQIAQRGYIEWDKTPVIERAECLMRMADLLERDCEKLMAIAISEAGKTIPDAIAEVREAVDFCRYYAMMAKEEMATPVLMPGPTGEENYLTYHGRGIVLCISPWNFPLAIFLGQITAALVTGNAVIAKPAEQTPLIAQAAVELLLEAGIPANVIQCLPGKGETIGAALVADLSIKGVVFTGSTETAHVINKTLASRGGEIVPLIAETGGQNAMIVDSSALPEQVVQDVVLSAFGSAGQRCSALRVLFVQEDIADKVITMLKGAMDEVRVGDPALLSTDVGPVIDQAALDILQTHFRKMSQQAELLCQVHLPKELQQGTYFAPAAFEIGSLDELEREVFGPCLHVLRYKARDLDKVIDSINNTGYGLTLGIHSRIDEMVNYIKNRVRVGNTYVNRSMTGAVVGVQPFGGEGLSGTGPKAGGPHYLHRLSTERTLSVDTTAAGGNASLMSLGDD